MKNRLYVATFSENAVEVIAKYGVNIEYNHICISENLDFRDKTIKKMKSDKKISKAKKGIVHGPFTEIVPASIDPRAVKLGLDRLNEAYEICSALDVKKMVVHSGYIPQIYYKQWHIEKSVKFWKKYMKNKPKDFKIFIENVFEDEPYMMKELIEKIADSRVKVCLDIGHANTARNPDMTLQKWVDVLGDSIGHIHVHNNYGKKDEHNNIGDGEIEIIPLLEKILGISDATICVESKKAELDVIDLLQMKF